MEKFGCRVMDEQEELGDGTLKGMDVVQMGKEADADLHPDSFPFDHCVLPICDTCEAAGNTGVKGC